MSGRNVFAFLLMFIGAIILLNMFVDGFSLGVIFSTYWPVILIAIGGMTLIRSSSVPFGSLIVLLVGVYFLLRNLGQLPDNAAGIFWATALIVAGLWMIVSRRLYKDKTSTEQDHSSYFALMSGTDTRNVSRNYKGGSAFALMGAVELDLRDAQLAENGAYLECTAIMGGIEIRVPDDWVVHTSNLPLMGSCENHTKGKSVDGENRPVLKVQCTAIMGGIEIRN